MYCNEYWMNHGVSTFCSLAFQTVRIWLKSCVTPQILIFFGIPEFHSMQFCTISNYISKILDFLIFMTKRVLSNEVTSHGRGRKVSMPVVHQTFCPSALYGVPGSTSVASITNYWQKTGRVIWWIFTQRPLLFGDVFKSNFHPRSGTGFRW